MSRWQSANVLQTTPGLSHLWRFDADGEKFTFDQEQTCLPSEVFSASWVTRDWRSLLRPKFNLSWLPPEKAFLRVLHLPASEPSEIVPMVEFQLEKLSPLPVNQIVWSVELLPRPADKEAMQTVIVVIAPRNFVEEHLAGIEAKGFIPDCLELPCLDQLLNTKIDGDGVWVYLGADTDPALAAWWYGGVLRNLALIPLSAGEEREKLLMNQLEQVAWSGELEGWLNEPPTVHLVAEPAEMAIWEPAMRKWVGESFKIVSPIAPKELAAHSAHRATRTESRSNLLPPDFAKRYQQQFIDGLWMRGLMTTLAIYALGVVVYLTALFVLKTQNTKLQNYVASISDNYTTACRDMEQIRIIKDRQELKYAALDCWKAIAQTLPEAVMLDEMYFQRGKLNLQGTVPAERQYDITAFHQALRHATVIHEGPENIEEPLFADIGPPTITVRGASALWKFTCSLKGGDEFK